MISRGQKTDNLTKVPRGPIARTKLPDPVISATGLRARRFLLMFSMSMNR